MRRVARRVAPAVLVGTDSVGGRERERAVAFFADAANAGQSFRFQAYKHDDVKLALNTAFAYKCAYCESFFGHVHPLDVEHFRPKSGYVCGETLCKPGYYWLAADWMNLLPSCIDCNRERTKAFAGDDPHLSGKANKFPISSEAKRARRPGDERREGRLLLHPYLDHPERHLSFDGEGIVRPALDRRRRASPKGRASIETFGLLRTGLVHERQRIAMYVRASARKIEEYALELQERTSPRIERMLREEIAFLKTFLEPTYPYSTMARQLSAPLLKRIGV